MSDSVTKVLAGLLWVVLMLIVLVPLIGIQLLAFHLLGWAVHPLFWYVIGVNVVGILPGTFTDGLTTVMQHAGVRWATQQAVNLVLDILITWGLFHALAAWPFHLPLPAVDLLLVSIASGVVSWLVASLLDHANGDDK
ncbi:hypothetical protein [Lacticaseibacillus daqingensis]|uniref:hypothetical protein n=1 Tax=Lacticaseibacillus daqingensis TaxID=2486014 RepID=UPI000F77E544|nr:hypothetical protein [Lacticaseibacillus daqingensis]